MGDDYNKSEQNKAAYNAYKETEKDQMGGYGCGCITFVAIALLLVLLGVDEVGSVGAVLMLIIAIAVGIFVAVSNEEEKSTAVTNAVNKVKTEQQHRANIIEDTFNFARQYGFDLSTKVVTPKGDSCLILNAEKKQWILKTPDLLAPALFNYDDLISYDLCCDGNTVYSSNVGSAILGAILAGTAGAVIGAATTRQAFNTCTSMYIKISDGNARVYRIHLLDETVPKSSPGYKMALTAAEEFAAMLDVIKANK